jgi:hypothetical protein
MCDLKPAINEFPNDDGSHLLAPDDGLMLSDIDNELEEHGQEDTSVMIDCEDVTEESVQAPNDVHRISWKCGLKSPIVSPSVMQRAGIWQAVSMASSGNPDFCHHGRYATSWDGLFANLDADDGIDDLVDMFDGNMTATPEKTTSKPTVERADKLLLSQPSRNIVEEVEGAVECHADKLLAVESLCDSWRENIAYPFTKEQSEVYDALHNVKQSKASLQKTVSKIVEAFQRREALLELYELSLEKALDRLQTKSNAAKDNGMTGTNGSPCKSLSGNLLRTLSSCASTPSHCILQCASEHSVATALELETSQ